MPESRDISPGTPEHGLRTEEFLRLLGSCDHLLFNYILALAGNMADADEIAQETKLRLWEQFDRFQLGTDFRAWACTVAYYQVLDFRNRRRPAECQLSAEFFELLAEEIVASANDLSARQRALEKCLDQLKPSERDVVLRFYDGVSAIDAIAASVGRSSAGTYQWMWRIRTKLHRCVENRLRLEET